MLCIFFICVIIKSNKEQRIMENNKQNQKTAKSPYSGIYLRSIAIGFGSFAAMYMIYITTGNPAFRPESAINSSFFFALVAPVFMSIKIYMQTKRYKIYEEGIGDYRIKVPISILINKGYLYVGSLDIYLVFATTRPHFISSVKLTNVVKVTFYDKDYVCLTLKNRREEDARNLYTIKFRVEDNLEGLMAVFEHLFEGRIENKL